jgi:hypothetical protein
MNVTGIGGTTGALGATSAYTLSGADTQQITTVTSPSLALTVTETETETQATGGGVFTVYPDGATRCWSKTQPAV